MVIMVVRDNDMEWIGNLADKIPAQGSRCHSSWQKGPFGKDGIGQPVIALNSNQKGGVPDPGQKIFFVYLLDAISQMRNYRR